MKTTKEITKFSKWKQKLEKLRIYREIKQLTQKGPYFELYRYLMEGYTEEVLIKNFLFLVLIQVVVTLFMYFFYLMETAAYSFVRFFVAVWTVYWIFLVLKHIFFQLREHRWESFLIFQFVRLFELKFTPIYLLLILLLVWIVERWIMTPDWDLVMMTKAGLIISLYVFLLKNMIERQQLERKITKLFQKTPKKETVVFDPQMKKLMDKLDHIDEVVDESVREKLKTEQFKTELLTNVSHDLKTPLTSMINYIDLLKEEEDPEERQRYLDILSNSAQRMKILMLDLIYASKTSTANLQTKMEELDMEECFLQVYGSFDEAFNQQDLQLIINTEAQKNISVYADGEKLSRVFENLITNVLKYTQDHTRVYVDLYENEGIAIFRMKNVSHEMINMEASQLMEQFVRGERSRNTEGSGLGLYIAKNLVELMGGQFEIQTVADLFIVEMKLQSKKQ